MKGETFISDPRVRRTPARPDGPRRWVYVRHRCDLVVLHSVPRVGGPLHGAVHAHSHAQGGLAVDRAEKLWFAFLILAALAFNVFTLSPVIPWQRWLLWSSPTPDQRIQITVE